MPRPVISVENLSKAYRIGLKDEIPDTLMGAMKNVATAPWRNFHRLRRLNTATATAERATPAVSSPLAASRSPLASNPEHVEAATTPDETDTLWALRDVSFEVNEGDVVGIIGRNGAGKSTLLKILSRITEPTSGRAVIRGRVSSLLEVGTGFHPELTGRENIYMNGTILGMRKKEIDRKFDEIVDFSGVEKFLDTPTKRYSSGMQVRLAFAVAAHLEPEILIIDEVLAVGDIDFQQKCLGKMKDVATSGRTVIFVSHNMAAVQSLCQQGIVLANGTINANSDTAKAVECFLNTLQTVSEVPVRDRKDRRGCGMTRLSSVTVLDAEGLTNNLVTGRPATFIFCADKPLKKLNCSFTIYDTSGVAVTNFTTGIPSPDDSLSDNERTRFICKVPVLPLRPGKYSLNVALELPGQLIDHVEAAIIVVVNDGSFQSRRGSPPPRLGAIWVNHSWSATRH